MKITMLTENLGRGAERRTCMPAGEFQPRGVRRNVTAGYRSCEAATSRHLLVDAAVGKAADL